MHTHERQEDGGLNPPEHPLDIVLVVVLVSRTEESSGIISPPGNTGCLHTQSCRDLSAESLPVVAYIARPHGRPVALDPRESATSENHGTSIGLIVTQSLIDGLVDQQGIDVAEEFSRILAVPYPSPLQVVVLRFCRILPPGINS